MDASLSFEARALFAHALKSDARFATFDHLAEVDVGIVTGANKFFLVTDEVVEALAWRNGRTQCSAASIGRIRTKQTPPRIRKPFRQNLRRS